MKDIHSMFITASFKWQNFQTMKFTSFGTESEPCVGMIFSNVA